MSENTKYPAILFISKVIRFFAWCCITLAAFAMIYIIILAFDGVSKDRVFVFLGVLVGTPLLGGFLALILFSIAESMMVLIDIEYNTRK
jgi:hypothetical protein